MKNQYIHSTIKDIIEHNENMRSFVLDSCFDSRPGQFGMVWLPGVDEKPISLSGRKMITVQKVGPWSEAMFDKKEGDYLNIRGPYGNNFVQASYTTLIGGGCGIAPLFYLFSESDAPDLSFVLAGKSKDDLIFLDDILESAEEGVYESEVITVTEDGSYGIQGIATDAPLNDAGGYFYICGPERMMEATAEKLISKDIHPQMIYLSLERYMKCAVGVCGNCSINGHRVCSDGPVFRYDQIKDLPHFGKSGRSRTGELVDLE